MAGEPVRGQQDSRRHQERVDPRIAQVIADAQETVTPRQREIIKLLKDTTTARKTKKKT